MLKQAALPTFIEPMLARPGKAFDSDDYLFEVKWDGTRAVAYVEEGGVRLMNRRRIDITFRYPDLSALGGLPSGTVIDGEIVILGPDGRSVFNDLQSREQARTQTRIAMGAKLHPATFMAFDMLYQGFESMMKQPCVERRRRLQEVVDQLGTRRLMMSEGVTGRGVEYFQQCCELGLEGMIAKKLNSPYLPGKRTDAWIKIKRQQELACVVIGFVPDGKDFEALIIAAPDEADGMLRCVGKVGTGFDGRLRLRLNEFLWSNLRDAPVVSAGKYKGNWVEPALCCIVRCMERTTSGQLRAPVFVQIIKEGES